MFARTLGKVMYSKKLCILDTFEGDCNAHAQYSGKISWPDSFSWCNPLQACVASAFFFKTHERLLFRLADIYLILVNGDFGNNANFCIF